MGHPSINTLLLLSSGVTVTWAHWALKKGDRGNLIFGLALTIILGVIFLSLQAYEYGHAYSDLNLKLSTGIFGSTFFMLTGFHGFHVTLGVTMLIVILFRCVAGHFKPDHHFGFEAVCGNGTSDVVGLLLFCSSTGSERAAPRPALKSKSRTSVGFLSPGARYTALNSASSRSSTTRSQHEHGMESASGCGARSPRVGRPLSL